MTPFLECLFPASLLSIYAFARHQDVLGDGGSENSISNIIPRTKVEHDFLVYCRLRGSWLLCGGCSPAVVASLGELCPGRAASAVVAHALEVVLGGSSPGA